MQTHKLIEDMSTHACATRELLILLIVQVGVIITLTNCISSSPETPLRISIIKLNLNNRGCVVEGYSQPLFDFVRVENVFQAIKTGSTK